MTGPNPHANQPDFEEDLVFGARARGDRGLSLA